MDEVVNWQTFLNESKKRGLSVERARQNYVRMLHEYQLMVDNTTPTSVGVAAAGSGLNVVEEVTPSYPYGWYAAANDQFFVPGTDFDWQLISVEEYAFGTGSGGTYPTPPGKFFQDSIYPGLTLSQASVTNNSINTHFPDFATLSASCGFPSASVSVIGPDNFSSPSSRYLFVSNSASTTCDLAGGYVEVYSLGRASFFELNFVEIPIQESTYQVVITGPSSTDGFWFLANDHWITGSVFNTNESVLLDNIVASTSCSVSSVTKNGSSPYTITITTNAVLTQLTASGGQTGDFVQI